MEVTQSTREFKYAGVVLKDLPGKTLEEVRTFYANLYPEIVNAAIEGPTIVGAKTVYEFRRAVGTKGAEDITRQQIVDKIEAVRKTMLSERAAIDLRHSEALDAIQVECGAIGHIWGRSRDPLTDIPFVTPHRVCVVCEILEPRK
jgi:PRTRC genetic system protein C